MVALPYLMDLVMTKENWDFTFRMMCVNQIGFAICCEKTQAKRKTKHEKEWAIYDETQERFKEFLLKQLKDFNVEEEKWKSYLSVDDAEKSALVCTYIAVFGDALEAMMMIDYCFSDGEIGCIDCDTHGAFSCYDGEYSFEGSGHIEPRFKEEKEWNRIDFGDIFFWSMSFLEWLQGETLAKALPYYYGRYICSECGGEREVMEYMKETCEMG